MTDKKTKLLFVHGMGRSPLSGWPMLRRLRRAGFSADAFSYFTSFTSFDIIVARLATKISAMASQGNYVLIGHSLGGVLIRAALARLASDERRPSHVFLLGSPVRPSRLAKRLQRNPIFRLLTGSSGLTLASEKRMSEIPPIARVTGIYGTKGFHGRAFGKESNDGIVALSETRAPWIIDEIMLPTIHTLLPCSKAVTEIILKKLAELEA